MKNQKTRSPFGELVHALRKERRWTQARLALEATPRQRMSETRGGITERSIRAIEHRAADPGGWTIPRQETVTALATAFALGEGSPDQVAFLRAAASTRQAIDRPTLADPASTPERRFVPAGRERHLDTISAAIDQVVTSRPQALFVTAEAGTGKTWLIVEACRQAVANHENLVVLWGNSQRQSGIADPYQPFRQILRMMVGDTRSTSPPHVIGDENLGRIRSRIPLALTALDEIGRDLLHQLLPLEALNNATAADMNDSRVKHLVELLSDQPVHYQVVDLAASVNRLLQVYASEGPVVLVLEDLHTGDGPTMRLLASLLQELQTTSVPIMVLASYRPVAKAPDQAGADRVPPLMELLPTLDPQSIVDLASVLADDAGERFISALAAEMGVDLDANEVARIRQQTLGLPVFVEGVLRLRREAPTGDAMSAAGHQRSRSAVFDAELEMLAPPARRALLVASVQGTNFSLVTLSGVLDTPVEHLAVLLDDTPFRRMGLVQPAGVSSLADGEINEFQFSHVLLRNHLYESCLSDIERAHWHLRTAEALAREGEETPHDRQVEIAFHLEQAGEPVAAAEAWLKVATDLITRYQFDRAESLLTRVREQDVRRLAPALEAEALLGLATCARGLDRPTEAKRWLELGLDLVRRRHLPALEARMLSDLGMIAYDAGQVKRGAELLRSAVAINEETGNHAEAAHSLARLSHNLYGLGLYEAAMHEAQRGLDLALLVDDEHLVCAASIALANCWLDLGRYDPARELYASTLEICERLADIHRANICLINISLCGIEQENWDAAARALGPFGERSRPVVPRFVAVIEFQAGLIAEGRGDWSLAQRHFAASMDIRQRNGQSALLIDALAGLLRVATVIQDMAEVRRLVSDIDLRVARQGLDGIEHAARVCLSMMEGGELVGNYALAVRYAETGLAFLDARAAAISTPAVRHAYLEMVPTHQRLRMKAVVMVEKMGIGDAAIIVSD